MEFEEFKTETTRHAKFIYRAAELYLTIPLKKGKKRKNQMTRKENEREYGLILDKGKRS